MNKYIPQEGKQAQLKQTAHFLNHLRILFALTIFKEANILQIAANLERGKHPFSREFLGKMTAVINKNSVLETAKKYGEDNFLIRRLFETRKLVKYSSGEKSFRHKVGTLVRCFINFFKPYLVKLVYFFPVQDGSERSPFDRINTMARLPIDYLMDSKSDMDFWEEPNQGPAVPFGLIAVQRTRLFFKFAALSRDSLSTKFHNEYFCSRSNGRNLCIFPIIMHRIIFV